MIIIVCVILVWIWLAWLNFKRNLVYFFCAGVFVIFLICIFAESNRAPFVYLPEAESELVSVITWNILHGFCLFFFGGYINLFLLSALVVDIFMGEVLFFLYLFVFFSFFFSFKVLLLVVFFIWFGLHCLGIDMII